jgi:2'-5' RNA ligase
MQPGLDALRRDLAALGGARLHPDHFLHIMVQELGFVVDTPGRLDEISAARLEEFAQAATTPVSELRPFPLVLGGANSFQDAAFLDIRGGDPLARIHGRLFDLAAIPHAPDYPYLPHCTIAHYDGTLPTRSAVAALAPWRETVFGGFTVSELEIITLDPSQPYPAMASYAVIPLGG